MKNINDNIITINGSSEHMFDKAIFVLKPEFHHDPNSLDYVKEADRILNNYMLKAVSELQQTKPNPNILVQNNNTHKKISTKSCVKSRKYNNMIDKLLGFSIFICSFILLYLLMTMWANGKTIFKYNK